LATELGINEEDA
jgi:cAMP-dependent protein kinase regulator